MADLGGHLPPSGSAVWSRDVRSADNERSSWTNAGGTRSSDMAYTMIVRHVVIGDAEIWEEPTPYVVYRINVHTQQDQWFLYRRYSQFHTLHKKLVKAYGLSKELLPPKKMSGNLSKQLIDKRRKSLERYLQKLVHNNPEISRSPELQVFLDVPTHDVVKVTDILTRHLYLHGDHLLENDTPIALSINELYAITLRLQLPRDTSDGGDVAGDLAHLYGFVHQLKRLRITPPPPPCSVTCMTFDLSPFRSLQTLKLDHVKMTQVCGLLQLQQHLERLTVQWTLHSLDELLVVSVEERRRGSVVPGGGAAGLEGSLRSPSLTSSEDSWRKSATEKFTSSRVVVRSWQKLHVLVLSHNFLTHLDDSLDLLPSLRELNLSHNRLQVLSLPFLCLPNLEKLNVSHNQIHSIDDKGKVLERITHLNLSHNRIYSLDGVKAFVGVHVLNLAYNRLVSGEDVSKILKLRRLSTLGLEGNPISSSGACRIVVLAMFKIAGRKVELDGLPATSRDESRIESYITKYGKEPYLWPIAKPLLDLEKEVSVNYQSQKLRLLSASEPGFRHPRGPGSTTPPSPHMDLTLQTHRHNSTSQQRRLSPSLRQTSDSERRVSPNARHASPHTRHTSPGQHQPSSRNPPGTRGDARATPPLTPHSRPSASSRTSVDRLSFSSSEHSVPQVSQSLSASYRPSSAKMYRRYAQPDEATPTRPHPSSSFSGTDFYSALPEEERYSVGVAYQQGSRSKQPRSDPDGQSDVSSTSPDFMLRHPASSRTSLTTPHRLSVASALSLSPPPPSPSLDLGQLNPEAPPTQPSHTPHTITPAMIQSALDALEGIQDKGVPLSLPARHSSVSSASRQSPVLPGEVSHALTAWISSQSLHQPLTSGPSSRASIHRTPLLTPPPTPKHLQSSDRNSIGGPDIQQEGGDQGADSQWVGEERQGISAQDLIDALSTLIVNPDEKPPSSRQSSRGGSVPACTPREGFSEWAKMGIRPEEVIHALSALTIHQEEDCEDDHRRFEQRSPTASPEPFNGGGGFPQEGGGHLCLFPETKEYSGEEDYERHRTHVSVSPPEPELEQLDPFLHPHLTTLTEQPLLVHAHQHKEHSASHFEHSGSHFEHSGSHFEHSGSSLEPTELHLQPSGSHLEPSGSQLPVSGRSEATEDGVVDDSCSLMVQSDGVVDDSCSSLMVQSDCVRDNNSLNSHSSGEDVPQEDHHGNGGVPAQVEEGGGAEERSHQNDDQPENTAEHNSLEVGVEVGVVSSSPIESCLYADS